MVHLTRRSVLAGSLPVLGAGALALRGGAAAPAAAPHADHGQAQRHPAAGHADFRGAVDRKANGFDPHAILRDFDFGKTTRLPGGRVLREWTLISGDQDVEVAPGVTFPAWSYNGRIPGPTLRAREGDRVRVTFVNGSDHPHTIHFHGLHPAPVDGVHGAGAGAVAPGGSTTYEFDATPFGLHLYHCHTRPLAEHIAKGLYGAFIIDPAEPRADADEMVMVMNGFDTNFDRANEVYAVNSIGFAYLDKPIRVERDALVRIYLVNVLEYDLLNSFHVHGNFFHYFPTGTSRSPAEYTDTVMQCQGQRGIVEACFPYAGRYMFHAHQSEFAELGWQGLFEVGDGGARPGLCRI
ncbi:MAG TPA: multicopper oxidase domain-containing protein [Solirubrobacteraceae bacterium]|nr:multicopper oxidase domain-containing protein [Solirubrobacteraceae bacterium]